MPNLRRTKKLQRKWEKCEDPMRKQEKDMLSVFYQLGCNSDAGDYWLMKLNIILTLKGAVDPSGESFFSQSFS